MITLDSNNQFVTADGKELGVFMTKKRGRYLYRDVTGTLYGSGMPPAEFVRLFWKRDDFTN